MKGTVAVVIIAIAVIAVLGVVVGLRARRQQGKRSKLAERVRKLTSRPAQSGDDGFVGRQEEQHRFRQLLDQWSATSAPSERMLIVCGPAGVGKRSLLERLERICGESGRRCGPVLGPANDTLLDQLSIMEAIARRLHDQHEGAFSTFFTELDRLARKASGEKTPLVQALDAVRGSSQVGSQLGIPGLTAASTVLGSDLLDRATEGFSPAANVGDAELAFLDDLGRLAVGPTTTAPVVLLFDDLDRWPDEHGRRWLNTTLFPRLAGSRVLFVVSVETDDIVRRLESVLQAVVLPLRPLSSDETRDYVTRIMRLSEATLVDQVVERSEGLPGRLAGFKTYFDRHPDARRDKELPTGADAWALSTSVAQLLERLPDSYLRHVVLASSSLRWFNQALLNEIATAAGLEPASDGRHPSDIVDVARPSWVVNRGLGWGVDAERLALLDHARRLDPSRQLAVHGAAAWHHYRRLCEIDRLPPIAADHDATALLAYRARLPAVERRDNPEHTAHLAELAYHLLALYPDLALAFIAEHAMEALFEDQSALAESLLDLGNELPLSSRQRFYLDTMRRCATAGRLGQRAEALKALEELEAAGAPTDLVAGATSHVLGERYYQIDRTLESLLAFERAHEIFVRCAASDPRAARMRCMTATWLAQGMTQQNGLTAAVSQLLEETEDAAVKLDDRTLVGEMRKARGVILLGANRIKEAEASYRDALADFRAASRPKEVALTHLFLAGALAADKHYGEATGELDSASAIFHALADAESQAGVGRQRLALLLAMEDYDAADRQRDELLAMRPTDAEAINGIGVEYGAASRLEDAAAMYARAIDLDRAPLYLANLARIRVAQWRSDEAIPLYDEAVKLAPTDTALLLELAQVRRTSGDDHGARTAARTVCDLLLLLPPIAGRLPPVVSDRLLRAVDLLWPDDAIALLTAATERYPGDDRLHFRLAQLLEGEKGRDFGSMTVDAVHHLQEARRLADGIPEAPVADYVRELAALHMDREEWEAASAFVAELGPAAGSVELERRLRRFRSGGAGRPSALEDELVVNLATDVCAWFDPTTPAAARLYDAGLIEQSLRAPLEARLGVSVPSIRFREVTDLLPGTAAFLVHGVLVRQIHVASDYLADDPDRCRTLLGAPLAATTLPWDGSPGVHLTEEQAEELERAGVHTWNPGGVVLSVMAAVIEQHPASLVGRVGVATKLAGLRGTAATAAEVTSAATLLRERLAAGPPAGDSGWIDELLAGPLVTATPAATGPITSDQPDGAAGTEPPDPDPAAPVALHFTADRWEKQAEARPVTLVVTVSPALAATVGAAAAEALARVVAVCTDSLALPAPHVRLHTDDSLPEWGCTIELGGALRVAYASLHVWPEVWTHHPLAGSAGRTGLAVGQQPLLAALIRAVEEAVWDDPSRLVDPADERGVVAVQLSRWRIGLGGLDGATWSGFDDPLTRAEQAAVQLRPAQFVCRLGTGLHADPLDGFRPFHEAAVDAIYARTGVLLPRELTIETGAELPSDDFEIVLDGLPRARGRVHKHERPPEVLAAALGPCLDAITAEYADALWMQQHLLGMTRQEPELVTALRASFSTEFLAAVVRQLVAGGASARNRTMFERFIEIEASGLASGRDPDVWAELLRAPAPGYVPWPREVPADRYGASMRHDGSEPLAGDAEALARSPVARSLLVSLDRELPAHPFGAGACLVVDRPLRPAVASVVAAQFPGLSVFSPDELPDGFPCAPLSPGDQFGI